MLGPRRAADLPTHYNAVEILDRNLASRPDKIALYSERRELTFREVIDETARVGNALKRLDVRPGECVGILSHDCAEWATSFFGILRIGSVALGLNTRITPDEIAFVLRDSRTRVVIIHHTLVSLLETALTASVEERYPRHVIVIGDSQGLHQSFTEWLAQESPECQTEQTHRDDYGTLNYSSGTTGEPKGVFHAHKDYALTAQLDGVETLGLRENDRTFSNAKLFFVYGLGGNLFFPWYVGAGTILSEGSPRETRNVLGTIHRFKPTVFYNAPTGYAAALAQDDLTDAFDLSCLRLCVSAGEALPAPLWHAWKDRTGVEIIDGIGSTEFFHVFVSNRPGEVRPGSSGRPIAGYETKIVDENGTSVKPGDVGRLLVKGESAALGYLHQYEQTKRTFLGEWVDTGDKYRVDKDGYYWHAGRADDMLKVGGIWVSPVEVESVLIGHPAVAECAVVGTADRADLIKPKAFVVLAADHAVSDDLAQELIAHCTSEMAEYKRPRWVEFVDELPKTATGKIQRFKLRALGISP